MRDFMIQNIENFKNDWYWRWQTDAEERSDQILKI